MDVTRGSFDAAFAHLQAALPDCAFVAIDLEFTGLGSERPSHLDTPSQRYAVARDVSLTYPPIQCGLSLFRRARTTADAEAKDGDAEWEAIPFNFQLCPRAVFRTNNAKYPIRDRVLHFQASSIDFLVKHGFDFQHCFAHGISWLRKEDEASARAELLASYSAPTKRNAANADKKPPKAYAEPADREIMDKFRADVDKWLKECGAKAGSKTTRLLSQYDTNKRLLFNVVERNFPSVFLSVNMSCRAVGLQPHMRLEVMPSAAAAQEKMDAIRERDFNTAFERRMRDAVGFRLVIDALIAARKPLVVHHGLLDISKVLANFVAPLPSALSGFKRALTAAFPVLWDTRVMLADAARTRPWLAALLSSEQGRTLSGLLRALRAPQRAAEVPPVALRLYNAYGDDERPRGRGPWEDFGRYEGPNASRFAHEAGFDALETGRTFLYLFGMASGARTKVEDVVRAHSDSAALRPLCNRIYLGSCGGYFDIDLAVRAPVGALQEVEEAVEDARNGWISRADVLVISGVADEKQGELILKRDIPHSTYYKLAEQIVKAAGTFYHHRSSTVMALENGSFILIPQIKRRSAPAPKGDATRLPHTSAETPAAVSVCGNADVEMTAATEAGAMTSVEDASVQTADPSGEEKSLETVPAARLASETRLAQDVASTDSKVNPAVACGAKVVGEGAVGPVSSTNDANPKPYGANNADPPAARSLDADRVKGAIAVIRKEVEKLGLVVETYGEALLKPRQKRMRYNV